MMNRTQSLHPHLNNGQGHDRARPRPHVIASVLLVVSLLFLASCQGSSVSEPRSGSVSFSIGISGDPAVSARASSERFKAIPVNCELFGIVTIEAEVYDEEDNLIAIGGPWDCTQRHGTIDRVPEGTNRTVALLLRDETGQVTFRGQRSGITVTAGETTETGEILVTSVENHAPVFTEMADQTIAEGQTLTFTLSASDPDYDPLTFSYTAEPALPSGAALVPSTGVFTWTPGFEDSGVYTVTFVVSDVRDEDEPLSDEMTVTITVTDVNRPPVFDPIADFTAREGDDIRFTVAAIDPDGDAVTFGVEDLPSGAEFSPTSGEFTWGTGLNSAGTYVVTFTATDDGEPNLTGTLELTITVTRNRPPVLGSIGTRQVEEPGEVLTFTISATDPDGDALTYYAANLPWNAEFDPVSRTFTWNVYIEEQGEHKVLFIVVDDGYPRLSDYEEVIIEVGNMTGLHYPVLDPIGPQFAAIPPDPDNPLVFTISASDADVDDSLVFITDEISGPEEIISIYDYELIPDPVFPNQAEFSWLNDPFGDDNRGEGNYYIRIGVREETEYQYTDWEEVTITVGNVNRPPVLTPIGTRIHQYEANTDLTFVVTATDPERDWLTYSVVNPLFEYPPYAEGCFIDAATQTFIWRAVDIPATLPGYTYDDHIVRIQVSDGNGNIDFEDVVLRILE